MKIRMRKHDTKMNTRQNKNKQTKNKTKTKNKQENLGMRTRLIARNE